VAERSAFAAIWVTKTHCLRRLPEGRRDGGGLPEGKVLTDVEPTDAAALLAL